MFWVVSIAAITYFKSLHNNIEFVQYQNSVGKEPFGKH